ncbi:MAG: hypothetical protein M1817_000886 [Caeruleum heppii]|nr:MAG: hypothetical protein M1817_000886 [Caeruleum heppii]
MLLTSGQLSMGISSGIVFLFTTLLFLSGYILQQQTVHSLQAALHPPPRTTPHTVDPEDLDLLSNTNATDDGEILVAVPFGDPPVERGDEGTTQEILSGSVVGDGDAEDRETEREAPTRGWQSVAYVTAVMEEKDLCGALALFRELEGTGSRAARVLFVPRRWVVDLAEAEILETEEISSWRILRQAESKWRIKLVGIDTEDTPTSPLQHLLSLSSYTSTIYLSLPGFLLSRTPLDALLITPRSSLSAFEPTNEPSILAPPPKQDEDAPPNENHKTSPWKHLPPLLIHPSEKEAARIVDITALSPSLVDDLNGLLRVAYEVSASLPSSSSPAITRISETGYVHLRSSQIEEEDPQQEMWRQYRDDAVEACALMSGDEQEEETIEDGERG